MCVRLCVRARMRVYFGLLSVLLISQQAAQEVDKHLTEILAKLQVTGSITKIGDCQYQIGSKKVTMQIISGYLVGMNNKKEK
jgi:hypothetical protein